MNRSALSAPALLAAALLAGACDNPAGSKRPGKYTVQFIGAPAGASSFTPADIERGAVVGAAEVGGRVVAARWENGAFSFFSTGAPAGCDSEATAISSAAVVGEISCGGDTYGWSTTGIGRVDPAAHTFVDVNDAGTIVGTRGRGEAELRAFVVQDGAATVLLPPGAEASAAAGISDDGDVAVTAYSGCGDEGCARSSVWVLRGGQWSQAPVPRGTGRAEAVAVSGEGHVAAVGSAELDAAGKPENLLQPVFVWEPGDDLDALPVIPGTRVIVRDVSSLEYAVGSGVRPDRPAQPTYGIVWGGGRLYYLSERMERGFEPWQIEAAMAIDDEGRIAGLGSNVETGASGAVLLVPRNLR